MNCRAAQRLISAERDGALPLEERAALEAHVAGCADCRQTREALAAATEAWTRADRAVETPDVERAWQDIRREIRVGGHARGARTWWVRAVCAGVPLVAAAAVALVVFTGRHKSDDPEVAAASWAQFVQVDAADAAPVVTVDESSGWVVVWTDDSGGGRS